MSEHCGSEGGCAFYADLTGPSGSWRSKFAMSLGTMVATEGLPATLVAGDYMLMLSSYLVSDVIINNEPAQESLDATCSAAFTITPDHGAVTAIGTFRADDCAIEVVTDWPRQSPSPSTAEPTTDWHITVVSPSFPTITIECRGAPPIPESDCLAWAERLLNNPPAEPTRGGRLVLTNRSGGSRCAADFIESTGRVDWTAAIVCPDDDAQPFPARPTPSTTAPLGPIDIEQSDRFWGQLRPGLCPYYTDYKSLPEAIAGASLVIRGHPTEVAPVREGTVLDLNLTTIAIAEVIKGQPRSRVEGTLDLISVGGDESAALLADIIPGGDVVLFLMSEIDSSTEPVPDRFQYWYYLDTWHQSVYREIGGLVSIPNAGEIRQAFGRDTFPLQLGGRSYEAFVERIRSLVANGTGSAVPPGIPPSEEWPAC